MYEAIDGKEFKTKKGADNHSQRVLVERKQKELAMSTEEIQKALEEVSKSNKIVEMLLDENSWDKWRLNHISAINKSLLTSKKETVYYLEKDYGYPKELKRIKEPEYGEDELLIDNNTKDYEKHLVLSKSEVVDGVKEVFYKSKYTHSEALNKKLKEGVQLSEDELQDILYSHDIVYEEEGESGRWSVSVTSVFDVDGQLYALHWERGLTENQDNQFYEQPEKVELEEKEIVKKVTVIKYI